LRKKGDAYWAEQVKKPGLAGVSGTRTYNALRWLAMAADHEDVISPAEPRGFTARTGNARRGMASTRIARRSAHGNAPQALC